MVKRKIYKSTLNIISMTKKIEDSVQRISEKLDIVIGVLQDLSGALFEKTLIKDKVSYLASRGLSNKEISRALGISEKYVSKEKSLSNKNKQVEQNE